MGSRKPGNRMGRKHSHPNVQIHIVVLVTVVEVYLQSVFPEPVSALMTAFLPLSTSGKH